MGKYNEYPNDEEKIAEKAPPQEAQEAGFLLFIGVKMHPEAWKAWNGRLKPKNDYK